MKPRSARLTEQGGVIFNQKGLLYLFQIHI